MSTALRDAARSIFKSALEAVDVRAAVRGRIAREGDVLLLADTGVALSEVDRVLVIAMGKAAVAMYEAALEALGNIPHMAVVVGPPETLPPTDRQSPAGAVQAAVYLPGAHPTPDARSLHAAGLILQVLSGATARTVVLFLISGGASAMVEQPLAASIGLDDLAVFSRALVGSGLHITAMNTLRKHLSAVKGGRLAVAAAAAKMQCTLLISDVPAASPNAIASGPSLPDNAGVGEARMLFEALHAEAVLPASIATWFRSPLLPETPKASAAAFARAHWDVVLSSDHLERAAVRAARELGFHAVVDSTCDDWEYRKTARYLLDRSAKLARTNPRRTCLITVGEVGVSLCDQPGEGGRNQQFALWCAETLAREQQSATVLSAGSDGIDGHSVAAGAVCDETTIARSAAVGFSAQAALENFNTAPLLRAVSDAVHTGPTGNNLRDLRLVLTEPGEPFDRSK